MSGIFYYDEALFRLINGEWHTAFFDVVMPWVRNKYFWMPLYTFIGAFAMINFRMKGLYLVLALLITVGISDTVSSRLIKNTYKRLRPCHNPAIRNDVKLLVTCGSGYSFTSSHATNHFAVAMFLIMVFGRRFRKYTLPLLIWAGIISYGQVYVGVHYPLDVFVGSLLGMTIGYVTSSIFLYFLE